MLPHQERVVTELSELSDKLTKLRAFFPTEIFASLDTAEQERLQRQEVAMSEYATVLGERVAAFG